MVRSALQAPLCIGAKAAIDNVRQCDTIPGGEVCRKDRPEGCSLLNTIEFSPKRLGAIKVD
jgi:hypothetical protein